MKVIINKMPKNGKECIFGERVDMTSKYKCMFKSGLYSRCSLDCKEECRYLREEKDYSGYFPG